MAIGFTNVATSNTVEEKVPGVNGKFIITFDHNAKYSSVNNLTKCLSVSP